MFLLKQTQSDTKIKCPNDCPFEFFDKDTKYCPACGAELIKEEVPHDVFFCSHCVKEVGETWNYCPYCGEKKEDKKQS